jgi:hypothetical protein
MRAALGLAGSVRMSSAPVALGFGPSFQEDYLAYNSRQYTHDLFALVAGVYRIHYLLPIADFINRCAFWFSSAEGHQILGRGLFVRFGLDNFFKANIFRWHNNLHALYLCQNNKELGHFLLVDPLRHNLIASRSPFWMKGQGVTDSGLADNAPTPFTFRMEKLPIPRHLSPEEFWGGECEDLRRRPSIHPGETEYDGLRTAILASDALL